MSPLKRDTLSREEIIRSLMGQILTGLSSEIHSFFNLARWSACFEASDLQARFFFTLLPLKSCKRIFTEWLC